MATVFIMSRGMVILWVIYLPHLTIRANAGAFREFVRVGAAKEMRHVVAVTEPPYDISWIPKLLGD